MLTALTSASMAVLVLATLSLNYSPNGQTFVLNEAFDTASSLDFPLGGLALAACVQGRLRWSALFALLALLLHPLIGVWPLLLLLLWPLSWPQRWALLSLGIFLLVGAMVSEIGPFARFDAEWEAILRSGTHDVFAASPELMRWYGHGLQLMALLVAALHTNGSAARLYLLAALLSATGLVISMGASYVWPSQILIQAQPWRSMWLAAYLMPVALCHVLLVMIEALLTRPRSLPWLLLAVLAIVFMLRDVLLYVLLLWWLGAWLLRLSAPLRSLFDQSWQQLRVMFTLRWLPFLSLGLVSVALLGLWAELTLLEGSVPLAFEWAPPQLVGLLVHGGYGVGFALIAYLIYRYGHRHLTVAALLLMLLLAIPHWDMRSESERKWEASVGFGVQGKLSRLIKPGEVVLSDGRVPLFAWYGLRTANYTSPTQAIGMVFSREKTFELLRRTQHVNATAALENRLSDRLSSSLDAPVGGSIFDVALPRRQGVSALCKDDELDWLVLRVTPTELPSDLLPYAKYLPAESGVPPLWIFSCADVRRFSS
ncbi:MAG: hypothetical protein K2X64_03570 [Rhodocyclaceae bacterium]|nr:hypothetical protein [Rhodocyclaceae bacterium]